MAYANQFLKIFDVPGSKKDFILGESYKESHLNEIELLSWNWGVTDPSVPTGPPAENVGEDTKTKAKVDAKKSDHQGQSGPRPAQLTFTKTLDRSTTRLLNAMNNGEVFPSAVLAMEDAYKDSPYPFDLKIILSKVYVVSFGLDGSGGDAGVTFSENWVLTYEEIKFEYRWKTTNAGPIPAFFKMPADSDQGPSQKAPKTATEKASAAEEQFDAMAKKKGWINPADMEEFVNAWAKKKGLIK
jgi:type VI protein secretion system component Hcp